MTPAELTYILERMPWTFAKTMPLSPHWYTLRKFWPDDQQFVAVVLAIREHGEERGFGGRLYTYFDAGIWTYWTMGSPVEETVLINRARRT